MADVGGVLAEPGSTYIMLGVFRHEPDSSASPNSF